MSGTVCSHSISRRLARKLAVVTMVVLALLFAGAWASVRMLIKEKNQEEAQYRSNVIAQILAREAGNGGEAACLARVRADAPMRANTRLELWRADGSLLYADARSGVHAMSAHTHAIDFDVPAPQLSGGVLKARYTMDFAGDAKFGNQWVLVFVVVTLLAGVLVAAGSRWHVRRALQPLHALAAQTRAISPSRLDQRLHLADPASLELTRWLVASPRLAGLGELSLGIYNLGNRRYADPASSAFVSDALVQDGRQLRLRWSMSL